MYWLNEELDNILDSPLTQDELCSTLNRVHNIKAPGRDDTPTETYKHSG